METRVIGKSERRNALKILLEYVERWNKKDEDRLVAEAANIIQAYYEL